jgi:hypothetical protein
MNSPSLLAPIEALRAALKASNSKALDASTRTALVALQADLAEYLEGAQGATEVSAIDHLEEIALRFEAEHPAVGAAIREAINTLVKAGV